MNRNSRREDLSPESRLALPLPHPSWTYGSRALAAAGARLVPDEFWKRLGL